MSFYNDWAQRILHGQWTDHLTFYGLPGYAYLLAVLYKIFGYGPFVPGLLQACLDAGTATLLYKIGQRVFGVEESAGAAGSSNSILRRRGHFIGLAAAAGWALFVPAQAYSIILMPTAWLVFVFWFLVWRVVDSNRSPTFLACLAYGLVIGVTATGIATILFLVPLLVAAILLRGNGKVLRQAGAIAALVAGITAATAPCWIHNYFVARDPVLLSAHSGINFWIGNNPVANGYPRIPPGLRAGQSAMLQDSISVAEAAAGHSLARSAVSNYWRAQATDYIRGHFGEWLKLLATKLRNFWNAFQYDDLSIVTGLREAGVILPGPGFGLVAALALPGMFLGLFQLPRSRWIAAAILLHMVSLLSVFVTERYRLAVVPGLLLFAAFTILTIFNLITTRRVAAALGLVAAVIVATWFVSQPQRDPSLWALEAYNSGWQALESNNLPLAQKKLELAYRYVPQNPEINLALGNLWLERKDFARAEHYYLATLQLDPRHKAALTNLGLTALEQRQTERARELFRTALTLAPMDAKAHYLLARALFESGEQTEARAEIAAALKLKPDQPEFADLRQRIGGEPEKPLPNER
jgi:tetratricopeptide (TPR) repeat protein